MREVGGRGGGVGGGGGLPPPPSSDDRAAGGRGGEAVGRRRVFDAGRTVSGAVADRGRRGARGDTPATRPVTREVKAIEGVFVGVVRRKKGAGACGVGQGRTDER